MASRKKSSIARTIARQLCRATFSKKVTANEVVNIEDEDVDKESGNTF